jgi:hypothetical protein
MANTGIGLQFWSASSDEHPLANAGIRREGGIGVSALPASTPRMSLRHLFF